MPIFLFFLFKKLKDSHLESIPYSQSIVDSILFVNINTLFRFHRDIFSGHTKRFQARLWKTWFKSSMREPLLDMDRFLSARLPLTYLSQIMKNTLQPIFPSCCHCIALKKIIFTSSYILNISFFLAIIKSMSMRTSFRPMCKIIQFKFKYILLKL